MTRPYRSRRRHKDNPLGYGDIAVFAIMAFAATWYVIPQLKVFTMSAEERAAIEASVNYSGCSAAAQAGAAPIHRGEPGYRDYFDGDGDGIACENWG